MSHPGALVLPGPGPLGRRGPGPDRASTAYRQGLVYAREHRLPFWEAAIARDAAGLEAVHGDPKQALVLFETAIDTFHRVGNVALLATALAGLAVFFDRIERPELAATVYGASTHYGIITMVINESPALNHLRSVLGASVFDDCVATGAAMEPADAVRYAHEQIQLAREELVGAPSA